MSIACFQYFQILLNHFNDSFLNFFFFLFKNQSMFIILLDQIIRNFKLIISLRSIFKRIKRNIWFQHFRTLYCIHQMRHPILVRSGLPGIKIDKLINNFNMFRSSKFEDRILDKSILTKYIIIVIFG
jgi:hypothetical protein